jgi:hypothetical protein
MTALTDQIVCVKLTEIGSYHSTASNRALVLPRIKQRRCSQMLLVGKLHDAVVLAKDSAWHT